MWVSPGLKHARLSSKQSPEMTRDHIVFGIAHHTVHRADARLNVAIKHCGWARNYLCEPRVALAGSGGGGGGRWH